MTLCWSKRQKIKSMLRATESEILQQFEKTFNDPNIQGHSVAELEHVKCPSVALESGVSVSSHSAVDQPGIGEHEQRSAFSETHVSLDSVHDCPPARPVVESDDFDAEAPTSELVTSLRFWVSSFSVSLTALIAILSILRVFHPEFQRDAQTILKTQGEIKTKKMEGWGILPLWPSHRIDVKTYLKLPASLTAVKLQFSIDGLPLFRSSRTQFWPILATINADYSRSPFLVGLLSDFTKPKSVFEFLGPFIEDLSGILKNGNGQQIMAEVCLFICDAPARSFIKNIKSHNGYSGCHKCFQVGEWHNKVTYLEINVRLRKDTYFNSTIDDEHHLKQTLSPLASLVKIMTMFPLDHMHLCCLGVTRKLLYIWMRGKSLATRLSSKSIEEISVKLKGLGPYTPSEFSRKPRQPSEIDQWKATELRYFMLYVVPVLLKNTIALEIYKNFMLLSVAMHLLLSSGTSEELIDCAQGLLTSFVSHFGQLCGKNEITYNVHQLTHLASEYRLFGPLDNISAFPYENYLAQLKCLLRKPHLPLQQVVDTVNKGQKFMHPHHVIH